MVIKSSLVHDPTQNSGHKLNELIRIDSGQSSAKKKNYKNKLQKNENKNKWME